MNVDMEPGSAIDPSNTRLLLRLALGLTVTLVGVAAFAFLAGQIGAQTELGRADQALTDALRVRVPHLVMQVFSVLTHLADTVTLTLLCIGIAGVLVNRGQRWLALGWVIAVAGNGLLNQFLKQLFGRIRPLDPDGLALATGFSFPSGHSSGAVVTYGMLAYLAIRLLSARWHTLILLSALIVVITVGSSRLILRVHFASDVMAGFASGSAWLALCITSIEFLRWWRLNHP